MDKSAPLEVSALQKQLRQLEKEALAFFKEAKKREEIENGRVHYLGKKGKVSDFLKLMGRLSQADRPLVGQSANQVKDAIEAAIDAAHEQVNLAQREEILAKGIDVTEPARLHMRGKSHLLTQTMDEVAKVLSELGFEQSFGPEIERDFYNFEALNVPKDHPAREMQDTFYIAPEVVLRTHTSPVQIRTMLAHKEPPIRIMSIGRVYRRDQDTTHSPIFHQVEGLYVDKQVTFADLKGTLSLFVQRLFSKDAKIRLRPSFFPFTEPSAEVDVSCFACEGKGCRLCKQTGWIEILGAGMVDPEVFKAVGYDSELFSGFAFGMGIERIAMLRYGVSDIRLFYENDLRFLRQF